MRSRSGYLIRKYRVWHWLGVAAVVTLFVIALMRGE